MRPLRGRFFCHVKEILAGSCRKWALKPRGGCEELLRSSHTCQNKKPIGRYNRMHPSETTYTQRGNGQRANSLGRDAPWPQNPHLTRHRGEHTLDTSRTKTKNKRSALFLAVPLVPVYQPCLPVPPPRVCSWKRNKMMINVMLMSLLSLSLFFLYTAVD